MTDLELMKWALYALEGSNAYDWPVVEELKQRLAQPEQELVCVCGAIWEGQELVSTPLPRQWQGLTEDDSPETL